jgi:hypothetical protein
VYQVGSKDSGSQNFSSLALKRKAVGVTQILYTTAAATAATVTNGKKIITQIMLVIHKKSRKMKISEKKIQFFSSLNQYLLPSYSICGK